MKNKIILLAVFCASCSSTLSSIKPYHVDVQQGNVVDAKMMAQLRPGMTKSQVRYILGTPLIQDSFHQNRWDYFYQMRKDGQITDQRRVIVDFENEVLKGVRGDVVPAGSSAADVAASTPSNEVAATTQPDSKKGIFDSLKFWESDAPAKPAVVPQSASQVSVPDVKAVAPEVVAAPAPVEVATVETNKLVAEAPVQPAAQALKEVPAQVEAIQPQVALVDTSPVASPAPVVAAAPVAEAATLAAVETNPAVANVVDSKTKAETVAKPTEKSLWDKLKFWQDDAPSVKQKIAAAPVQAAEVAPAVSAVSAVAQDAQAPTNAVEASPVVSAVNTAQVEVMPMPNEQVTLPVAEKATPVVKSEPVVQAPVAKVVELQKPVAVAKPTTPKVESKNPEPKLVEAKPVADAVSVEDEKDAIDGAINTWAEAWRKKDVKTYLSAYGAQFVPEGLPSKKAWVAQRKQRLNKPGAIGLTLKDMSVDVQNQTAKVSFNQDYTSSNYTDHVSKVLTLNKVNKRWVIVKESVVPTLPSKTDAAPVANELAPVSAVESSETMTTPAADSATAPSATPSASAPIEESKTVVGKPAAKEEPNIFERMLEKIGF